MSDLPQDFHNGNVEELARYFETLPDTELESEYLKWSHTASNAKIASARAWGARQALRRNEESAALAARSEQMHSETTAQSRTTNLILSRGVGRFTWFVENQQPPLLQWISTVCAVLGLALTVFSTFKSCSR